MSLAHVRRGSGPPFALIHGIGSQWQMWQPVLDRVAREREVVALDLPGFGDSAQHRARPTVEALASTVAEFLDGLGLGGAHVAGNSLGGLLALDLARAQLVRSVTALSPAGFWNDVERRYAFTVLMTMRQIAQRMPLPVVERLARPAIGRTLLTSTIYARPGRRSPEAVVAETLALARAQGFSETLRSGRTVQFTDDIVGTPVTVAWGSRDRLLIPRQGVRAKSIIPRARLVRLPGCGHVPMNDDPALVARVVLDGSR
jgi:pimeloyl-ACP methyl ester carboxylesterase